MVREEAREAVAETAAAEARFLDRGEHLVEPPSDEEMWGRLGLPVAQKAKNVVPAAVVLAATFLEPRGSRVDLVAVAELADVLLPRKRGMPGPRRLPRGGGGPW